jgi:hypothetical protein
MIVYLDTNIVIYAIESPPVFGLRAQARLASARAAAVEHAANVFLTNDTRLSSFTGLTVEVLT